MNCPVCNSPMSSRCWAQCGQGYEEYMRAIVGPVLPDGSAELLVLFPAGSTEDNRMHLHPGSARRIEVLAGFGWFLLAEHGCISVRCLRPGDVVEMAAGRLHTFKSHEGSDMVVRSTHFPFRGLEGPDVIRYPHNRTGDRWVIPADLPDPRRNK